MQTSDRETHQAAAQAELATLCRTTIVAGMDATEDRTRRLVAHVKGLGHRGRFDLLTVPDPGRLLDDRRLFELVAKDAALAIRLHHGEQIVVAVHADPSPIVGRLKDHEAFRTGVRIEGLDLRVGSASDPRPGPDVAVTCMDFRQHDADLPERLRRAFDLSGEPAILATAGGAKEVRDDHPRGRRLLRHLRARDRVAPIARIVLTCHTDCGAMGGDAAPAFLGGDGRPDPKRQLKVLREHLKASVLSLRLAFPKARIDAGVVRLKDGSIDAIVAS